MSGVTGFGFGAIRLFINSNVKGWKTALKECVCHEFNHIVYNKYHRRETLLDNIIYEGLAEPFREHVVGGKQAPWSKALTLRECKRIFSRIEKLLSSKSPKVYRSVFFDFEDEKYPLWSGYSIGYQMHACQSWTSINVKTSTIYVKPFMHAFSFDKLYACGSSLFENRNS